MIHVLSLTLLTDPKNATEGPGWYIVGTNLTPRRVTVAVAETIARAFSDATPADAEENPFEVIRNGTQAAQQEAEEALREAEGFATKVPSLRKALADLGGQ